MRVHASGACDQTDAFLLQQLPGEIRPGLDQVSVGRPSTEQLLAGRQYIVAEGFRKALAKPAMQHTSPAS